MKGQFAKSMVVAAAFAFCALWAGSAFGQMRPGPSAIVDADTSETIGYMLVVQVDNFEYEHYFVLEQGTTFPLELDNQEMVCFESDAEIESSSPEAFYEWVESEGGLGTELDTHKSYEVYDEWNP